VSEKPVWLDCTLRDGGYYNQWDFSIPLINDYLHAMAESDVDRVELGFRTLDRMGYKGATAHTSNSLLRLLKIPDNLLVGVMINASEISGSVTEVHKKLARLFPPGSRDLIDFVRVASHLNEITSALSATGWLKSEGYEVGLNIMQVSEASDDTLSQLSGIISPEDVDVLYFADSLGSMLPDDIKRVINLLRSNWSGQLGVHAHDNSGLALANTLTAFHSGATWLDGTVLGMGRGAGNTRSELLLGHVSRLKEEIPSTIALEKLIQDRFQPLLDKGGWGPNVHYVRAAGLGIHPSFVQELLSNNTYSSPEITEAITELGALQAKTFKPEMLKGKKSWAETGGGSPSNWDQEEFFKGKDVLFLGSGPSALLHKQALESLASDDSLLVVALNMAEPVRSELIDARIACHPIRLIADGHFYQDLERPLIAPARLIQPEIAGVLKSKGLLRDLGIKISSEDSQASRGLITLAEPQLLAFSLLAALSGGARSVYLAGFDGYGAEDPRRALEQNLLNGIRKMYAEGRFVAITPTSFEIPQTSLYALLDGV
jgi:4-hydroxy 2-oxovalerate aldolase